MSANVNAKQKKNKPKPTAADVAGILQSAISIAQEAGYAVIGMNGDDAIFIGISGFAYSGDQIVPLKNASKAEVQESGQEVSKNASKTEGNGEQKPVAIQERERDTVSPLPAEIP